MSGRWLQVINELPDVRMTALVDVNIQAARSQAETYALKDAALSTDLQSILDSEELDVVFDCTPPPVHYEVTIAALAHGCHVLGEKPLADNMARAKEMVEASLKAGKIYAVIQNRRYDPRIRRLKNFLQSGRIGRPTTVNCDFYKGVHFGGFRDRMKHVLLLDMAIHTFDAARLITGADPVSVYCREWNPSGSWYDHDASAVAVFEMSGGTVYTYRGSWCSEGLNTSWESHWHIIGESGSVKWDGAEGFQCETAVRTEGTYSDCETVSVPPFDAGEKVGGHTGLIKEFIHCVRNGGTPETICTDNVKSLAMVFAAIESSRRRMPVEISV